MPVFSYVARDYVTGKKVKASTTATTEEDLIDALEAQGLLVISYKEVLTDRTGSSITFGKIPKKYIIQFLDMLDVFLDAGMALTASLTDCATAAAGQRRLSEIIFAMKDRISNGETLAEAMEHFPEAFDPLLVQAISAGESTGNLHKVLVAQIERLKKEDELRAKMISQSIYPGVLITFVMCLLVVVNVWFLPMMMKSYKVFLSGHKVPPKTAMVLKANDIMSTYGLYLPIVFASFGALWFAMGLSHPTKKVKDSIKMRIPLIKKIILYADLAQFAQTMAVGLSSGLSILAVLSASEKSVRNLVMSKRVRRIRQGLLSGTTLTESIRVDETDYVFAAMVKAGELSGKLPITMSKTYRYYVLMTERAMKAIVEAFNYVTLIFLAMIVLYIILSAIIPMYELPSVLTGGH